MNKIPIRQTERVCLSGTGHSGHVERITNMPTATPDDAVTVLGSAIPVERCNTGERRNLSCIDLPEFGQISEHDGGYDFANARD